MPCERIQKILFLKVNFHPSIFYSHYSCTRGGWCFWRPAVLVELHTGLIASLDTQTTTCTSASSMFPIRFMPLPLDFIMKIVEKSAVLPKAAQVSAFCIWNGCDVTVLVLHFCILEVFQNARLFNFHYVLGAAARYLYNSHPPWAENQTTTNLWHWPKFSDSIEFQTMNHLSVPNSIISKKVYLSICEPIIIWRDLKLSECQTSKYK